MTKVAVPRFYFWLIHVLFVAGLMGSVVGLIGVDRILDHLTNRNLDVVTIAHRGASGYAPESTLSAYRMGVRMADYIEIDLQLTRDGEIIVMHDDTVDRTTNGRGFVRNMTLAEIKQLDAGSWFNERFPMYAREEFMQEKVPTLRELFETFGKDTKYMLEVKAPEANPGLEEQMWALVEEYGLEDHVAVQSFSAASLIKIRQLDDKVPLFQLFWYNFNASITQSKLETIKQYANGIGANFSMINENYVHKVVNAGLLFYPYTVNFQISMDRAMEWGVDGLHTDYPDRFREVIAEYKSSRATSSS